jgi:hypothetical protein
MHFIVNSRYIAVYYSTKPLAQDDDKAVSFSALPCFLNSFHLQPASQKRCKKPFYVSLIVAAAVIDGESGPFQAVS